MFEAKIKNNLKFPKFVFQEDLKKIADLHFIPALQDGINRGVGIDNSPFPALEPKTIALKKGLILKRTFTKKGNIRAGVEKKIAKTGLTGFSAKTLIQTGKLISSFYSQNIGKSAVEISLRGDRKKIGKYLQIDGVGNKKKQFNFFGISKAMEQEAVNYMHKRIDEVVKNVR